MIKSPDEIYEYQRNLSENRDQFISYAEWLEIRYNEMFEALVDATISLEDEGCFFTGQYSVVIENATGMSWDEIKANK